MTIHYPVIDTMHIWNYVKQNRMAIIMLWQQNTFASNVRATLTDPSSYYFKGSIPGIESLIIYINKKVSAVQIENETQKCYVHATFFW